MTVSAFADVGRCDWLSLTNQWSLSRQVLECWSLFPKGCVLETDPPLPLCDPRRISSHLLGI